MVRLKLKIAYIGKQQKIAIPFHDTIIVDLKKLILIKRVSQEDITNITYSRKEWSELKNTFEYSEEMKTKYVHGKFRATSIKVFHD